MACEIEIPVLDQVCGDCGGKQSDLAASKLKEFASQREQAEEHRREYRFEDAISIARSLASVEDERIAEHIPLAKEFVTATESHWERERESASVHFDEARTHRDAFDYASAIHAIESAPEAMRTSEMYDYLQQLESDRAEAHRREDERDHEKDQAEAHRREYRFEDALRIARSLASVDKRLTKHVPWAEGFITATKADWERERESASAHFEEARTHREVFDYPSAIHAVESVPEAMRTYEMSDYLQQLESDRAESEDLITTISERVQRRDLQGLLEKVERAVELRGDRADLQKLQDQLREREAKRQQQREEAKRQREEACAEATRLFGTGDAKGALTMIQSVPSEDLRSSDETLRSELEKIVAAEDELTALVKDAKADGVMDPDEVAAMWQAAHSYL